MHYAKIEFLRRAALAYKSSHAWNYFDDLYRLHQALGLALENEGSYVLAYLTPVKEKEVLSSRAGSMRVSSTRLSMRSDAFVIDWGSPVSIWPFTCLLLPR